MGVPYPTDPGMFQSSSGIAPLQDPHRPRESLLAVRGLPVVPTQVPHVRLCPEDSRYIHPPSAA